MKIQNEDDKNQKKFDSNSFKEFVQDKKYRWMIIALPIMVVITIIQICIH